MERRRLSRPRLKINVRAESGGHTVGHVLNISDHGVCLAGRGERLDEAGPLDLVLPWAMNGERRLSVQAIPRWHIYLADGHWRAGYSLDSDESAAVSIATLISRYSDRTQRHG